MVYKEIKSNYEFKEATKNGLAVVYFKSTWCPPCRFMSPVFDEIAYKYATNLNFIKVDVDDMEEVAINENVTMLPSFFVYRNGKLEKRLDERIDREKIEVMCKQLSL